MNEKTPDGSGKIDFDRDDSDEYPHDVSNDNGGHADHVGRIDGPT